MNYLGLDGIDFLAMNLSTRTPAEVDNPALFFYQIMINNKNVFD